MAQKITVNGVDLTTFLQYGSMTVKFNTCDFTLIASSTNVVVGASLVVKDPGWSGTVVRSMLADVVNIRNNGYWYTTVGATNTNTVGTRPTPFNLSDQPVAATVSHFLLEDGSGALVLEDGSAFAPGDYALESSSDTYGYRALSVDTQINSADQSTSKKVTATIFQPGLWPGMSVVVTSTNLPGHAGGVTYVVTQVTTTWTAGVPTFTVEMTGSLTDRLPTLGNWRITG